MNTEGGSPIAASTRRVLDPMDRLSEIFFGLVMAMTFTGAISAAEQEREEIRTLLFGAISCNLAWGIIDAFMYLLSTLSERGRDLAIIHRIRGLKNPEDARLIIADALPPFVGSRLDAAAYKRLHDDVLASKEVPGRVRLQARDYRGATGVFLLVFASTFPLVVPFLFIKDAGWAVRASHWVGVLMLFLVGRSYGKISGLGAWRMGLAMIGVGLVLVALTIALGG